MALRPAIGLVCAHPILAATTCTTISERRVTENISAQCTPTQRQTTDVNFTSPPPITLCVKNHSSMPNITAAKITLEKISGHDRLTSANRAYKTSNNNSTSFRNLESQKVRERHVEKHNYGCDLNIELILFDMKQQVELNALV